VCNRHAEQSRPDAPKGSRRLCTACVRYCEGGTSEPVGVDEVTQCASCGKSVCTGHQAVCGVDGQVHCAQHRAACAHCGRQVCTADLQQQSHRCAHVAQLATIADPPEEVVAAALAATGGASRSRRAWRVARDRTHVVVELDLGWRRRTVFTLRHGDSVPESVVTHSLVGSKRRG
jgi:hypothetical protein